MNLTRVLLRIVKSYRHWFCPSYTLGLAGTRRDAGVSVVELNLNVVQEILDRLALRFQAQAAAALPIGKRGKTRGGMILRFPGGRESDSFWECRGPGILTVCRTPS